MRLRQPPVAAEAVLLDQAKNRKKINASACSNKGRRLDWSFRLVSFHLTIDSANVLWWQSAASAAILKRVCSTSAHLLMVAPLGMLFLFWFSKLCFEMFIKPCSENFFKL